MSTQSRNPLARFAAATVLACVLCGAAWSAPGEGLPGAAPGAAPAADKTLSPTPNWGYEGNDAFGYAGAGSSTIGDVNADGFSDFAVSAPGYTTFVNSTSYSAAIFIFLGTASGPANAPSQVLYSTVSTFGTVVAPAGDVNNDGYDDLLVGQPVAVGSGKAFVYLGTAGGLQNTAAWQYSYDGGFGSSVAPAGDINGDGYADILVGAPTGSSLYVSGPGLAFLFTGGASGPSAAPAWYWGVGGNFGTSVAGAGDVNADGYDDVIIGAPYVSGVVPVSYQGAAYIYHGGPSGLSNGFSGVIRGADQLGAAFGASVAGVGDVNGDGFADVAVGSPTWDSPTVDAGRAFVFPGSATGVSATAIWEEWGIAANVRFGADVQPAGDVNGDGLADVAVNAPGNTVGSGTFARYVVVVHGARAGIGVPLIEWYVTRNDGTDWGSSIGTAGDVNNDGFSDLMVGSSTFSNGQTSEGRVEIFYGAGAGPSTSAAQSFTTSQSSTYFAWKCTTVGDVNGDGFSDVAMSGPGIDVNVTDDGQLQLKYGSATGLVAGPQWAGPQGGGSFASSVAPAGDVNGDGYADMVVGAPLTGTSGRAYCWYGGPSGPSAGAANWDVSFGTAGAYFGFSVAGAGDVNNDGFADVVVGAPYDETDESNEGRAYLFLGSATGLSTTPSWVVEGNQVDANLGSSVAGAGDVNGDRYSDVVVGEPGCSPSSGVFFWPGSGRMLVYHGAAGGLGAAAATSIDGFFSLYQFGSSVASAGDVDGDGYSDILVAAYLADRTVSDEGEVYVYRGSPVGILTSAWWTYHYGQAYANLGTAIASAGDVNGDGFSDVIVGANFADKNGLHDNGEALVFAGPLTGSRGTTPIWSFAGQSSLENFGNSVGSAGDINGDGFSDIIVGSPGWTSAYYGQGRALVFYGNGLANPANTRSFKVQQRRGDDGAPLALLGDAGSPPTVRLKAEGTSSAGRGKLRIVWEIKAHGALLDGTGLGYGAWTVSGKSAESAPSTLDSGTLSLPAGTSLHWRARVASRSPYQPHSRWFSPQGNGPNEADLRTRAYISGVDLPAAGRGLAVVAAPNPFNPRTTLSFAVPREGRVRVDLFDLRGARVRVLLDEVLPAGPASLAWDGLDDAGRPLASGAYHARVKAGDETGQVRLMLVK